MKKALFGCLALFILLVIGGGYAAYRFVYLPGKAYLATFSQLKVVPELNAKVANQSQFTPPADNLLTEDSVARFVSTQKAIQAHLGARLKELETKYETIGERYKGDGDKPSITESIEALKDLMALFVDAKKAQVDALNAQGLSLAEYEWTRARVYEASGLPLDTTLQQIIQEAAGGKIPDLEAIEKAPTTPVPDKNRTLVKPYATDLAQGAALAFFAL